MGILQHGDQCNISRGTIVKWSNMEWVVIDEVGDEYTLVSKSPISRGMYDSRHADSYPIDWDNSIIAGTLMIWSSDHFSDDEKKAMSYEYISLSLGNGKFVSSKLYASIMLPDEAIKYANMVNSKVFWVRKDVTDYDAYVCSNYASDGVKIYPQYADSDYDVIPKILVEKAALIKVNPILSCQLDAPKEIKREWDAEKKAELKQNTLKRKETFFDKVKYALLTFCLLFIIVLIYDLTH